MTMDHIHEAGYFTPPLIFADGAVPDGAYGKTSPERSPRAAVLTLLPWLEKWLDVPLNSRIKKDGEIPVLLLDSTDLLNGSLWMHSTSEHRSSLEPSLNGGDVCSLSEILETGQVDPRYFLSPKACAGILRRAEKRGKQLPPMLYRALRSVAQLEREQESL